MMMSRYTALLAAALIVSCPTLKAQDGFAPEYGSYQWSADPKLHELSAADLQANAVIVLDQRLTEYGIENQAPVMYSTRHMIVRVNSDQAIEQYNRVYISMSGVTKTVDIRARAISKEGKVTNVNESNIKYVENYENYGPFKIFAIEGIEKGGEIEYIYTVRKDFSRLGAGTEIVRSDAPVKDFRIDLWSPDYLVFDSRSYNGLPDAVLDSNKSIKRHLMVYAKDIPGVENEEFSAGEGALKRFEYKFAYNTRNGSDHRLNTWKDATDAVWSNLHTVSKSDLKKVTKLIKTMNIGSLSGEERIRQIESYLKTSIAVREDLADPKYDEISTLLKEKQASVTGILRLYSAIFDKIGQRYEIVLTADRFDKKFDGGFDTWTYLQHYLVYFPDQSQFIAPSDMAMRYGFVPFEWSGQEGLFMIGTKSGKETVTSHRVAAIPELPYDMNMTNLDADITFDLDLGTIKEKFRQTSTGLESAGLQPYYKLIPSDDDRRKIMDDLLKNYSGNTKPENVKVTGIEEKDFYRNPFIIEADFNTNAWIEKAGPKYLFKIGQVIGPQSELYQEKKRQTNVENRFNHGYIRTIRFTVPDGYKVSNPDAVKMDVFQEKDGKRTMEFHSEYKQEGNVFTVTVHENYRQLTWPLEEYEQFRKVINAAADFNKIVLFLEKQ